MPVKRRKATAKLESISEDEVEEELILSKEAANLLQDFEEQGEGKEY